MRYDYFKWNNDSRISPRVGFSYILDDKSIARGTWGYFYQYPSITDFIPEYGGSRSLEALKAEHKILSYERELPYETTVKIEGFLKDYSGLISADFSQVINAQNEIYNSVNGGVGWSRGIELMVKNNYSEKISGWLTYTLSRARKKEYNDTEYHDYEYDRRHIFNVGMKLQPQRRLSIDMLWRAYSGRLINPYNMIDFKGSIRQIMYGEVNTLLTPPYNRFDVRFNKIFIYTGWQLSVYLEILNLFNTKNVSGYHYNNATYAVEESYGIPFFPFIGIEAKFM